MKEKYISEKIDFVILWVDGNDKKWLEEKARYSNEKGDISKNRFRDYGTLQYLFRGIEKFAPWVNKIFFITWGHVPNWLNTSHEKICVVKHEEFIPHEYLPTFNSNVIEMNLHRIKELSENFVLFNDDLFVLKKLKPTDFFEDNLPKDMYIEYIKCNCSRRHKVLRENYFNIINKYFEKSSFIKNKVSKVLSIKYGTYNFKTLGVINKKSFCDFYTPHLTQAFTKNTFDIVWKKEYNRINEACYNKFRADNDLGVGLFRYWQLLSGKFKPAKILGKYFVMSNDNEKLIKTIKEQKHKIICINDADTSVDFEKVKKEISNAFGKILRAKSEFEL